MLDKKILQQFNSGDYNSCIIQLKEEFKLRRNEKNEVILIQPTKQTLSIIEEILHKLSLSSYNQIEILLIKQCFEALRNSAASGENIQNEITNFPGILNSSYIILNKIMQENETVCLKMLMQFLCNMTVKNKRNQIELWNQFSNLINLSLKNNEVAHISSIILYNIFNEHTNLIPKDDKFIKLIFDLNVKTIENTCLIIELLIRENILTEKYPNLDCNLRVFILDNIYLLILSESVVFSEQFIILLSEQFKTKSDCILKTVTDYLHKIEPVEVAKLLECLAGISSRMTYLPILQKDKSLLINCVFLLKSIHEAGKNGDNYFSSIQKLSEVNQASDLIQQHPGFGFKAALIQLLANLSWEHNENQNMVRELDCISILLDCCNIDARNPLIIQWVILAVRNLCTNNKSNQLFIAETTKIGIVDSAILHEMGLTIHDDGKNSKDSKIVIAPYNLNK